MSFKFTPKSEEEIQSMNLMPDGVYDFEIKTAEQKVSKSGNDMIEIVLAVWDHAGMERTIFDYLVNSEVMLYKIKHLTDSIGLEEKYNRGEFRPADLIRRTGKVKIVTRIDRTGQYPAKNAVADYVKRDKSQPITSHSGTGNIGQQRAPYPEDDIEQGDIPF